MRSLTEKELLLMGEYIRGTLHSDNKDQVGNSVGYIGPKPPFQQIMVFSIFGDERNLYQVECKHGVRGQFYSEMGNDLWKDTNAADESTWDCIPDCKQCLYPARSWKRKNKHKDIGEEKRKWPWDNIRKAVTLLLALLGFGT